MGTLVSEFGTTVYTYNDNGNLTAEQTGSFATSYAYNKAGLLTNKQDTGGGNTILSNGYVYKLDGNIKSKTDIIDGVTNYSYDGMGRLKTEQAPATELLRSYQYDDYGNRWKMAVHEEGIDRITDYTYDKNNRLTKEQTTSGGTQANAFYNYDANGNQLSKVTNAVSSTQGTAAVSLDTPQNENILNSYDGFNRLKQTEVSKDGAKTVASYTYNAAGIRTSKTVDGVTTQHILDGANVVADVTGGLTTKYIRGMSLISMTKSNGDKIKYITDGHGDVRALAGQTGSVLKRYSYDAFGNESGVDEADSNPFRYCGEYFDGESGSIYLRARYYDPRLGRFGSEDPLKDSNNWYIYSKNNPVNFVDPNGLAAVPLRSFIESRGGTVKANEKYNIFGKAIGLKSVTVTLNGYTATYTSKDYTINSEGRAIIDSDVLYDNHAPINISDAGLAFIADYEGYGEMPYRGQDSQNRTVGYGHVITKADGSKYDNGISKADATELLRSDVYNATNQVRGFLNKSKILLSQNQFDALVSFTFNCGGSWLNDSRLKTALLNGDISKETISDAMLRWVKVNGSRSEGLVNRRKDEIQMFTDGDYTRD